METSLIQLSSGYHFSPYQCGDEAKMVEYLNCADIHNNTLNIPFPYRREDAQFWIGFTRERAEKLGQWVTFGLRDPQGALIGGIGMDGLEPGRHHQGELGYWLAKPYWGRGIMTETVEAFVSYAFNRWNLVRITAHVFSNNGQSRRVLEKNGFREEGFLRKHYLKNGTYLDARLFARLGGDLPPI